MMSKNAKRKILTAAVLCASTTLWASPVWAASGGSVTDGAYYGEKIRLQVVKLKGRL